jgi:hypothetical protein
MYRHTSHVLYIGMDKIGMYLWLVILYFFVNKLQLVNYVDTSSAC